MAKGNLGEGSDFIFVLTEELQKNAKKLKKSKMQRLHKMQLEVRTELELLMKMRTTHICQ